jgi:hypothetical protein
MKTIESAQMKEHWAGYQRPEEIKRSKTNQRETSFMDVMKIQMNYPFLGHNKPRTLDEVRMIKDKINKRIGGMGGMLKTAIMIIGFLSITGLSGCKKDDQKPQAKKEMITQEVKLTNFQTIPIKSEKQFDINQWVWNYNPTKADLLFTSKTDPTDNISMSVNIDDLIAGVQVSIYKDKYDISFKSPHVDYDASFASQYLDIEINMQDIDITGIPINLIGSYTDYLVVLDIPAYQSATFDGQGILPVFIQGSQGTEYIYYAYIDPIIEPTIGNLFITYTDGSTSNPIQIPGIVGNVYIITGSLKDYTSITFPNWITTKIPI